MAAITFEKVLFPVTDGSTSAPRTEADRWADVVNVLDFGADNTGNSGAATATTAAINAAIAVAAGNGVTGNNGNKGSTVFFPPGTYLVNDSIANTANGSVALKGSGMWCTRIRGTVTGFVIDDALGLGTTSTGITAIEDIGVYNDTKSSGFDLTTGAIRIGGVAATLNVLVKNVQFSGWTGLVTVYPSAQNATSFETTLINCSSTGPGSAWWNVISTTPYVTGPIGFYVGNCAMICCVATGYAVDLWFAGTDTVALRCRTEVAGIGVLTGITPRFDDVVAGASGTGTVATITSTTPLANFGWINAGQTQSITVQGVTPSGYNTTQVTGTRTGANTFTYANATSSAFVSGGTWTQLASNANADANVIIGHSTERCATAYFLANFGTSEIHGAIATGTVAPALGISGITWTAGSPNFATVTTTQPLANFNSDGNGTPWTSGTQQIKIESANPSGYNTTVANTGALFVTATWTGANTFTYTLTSNPGTYVGTATWSFQCQYGLRLKTAGRCVLESVGVGITPVLATGAGIDLFGGSAAHPTLISVTAGLGGWIMPSASAKSAYQYINCDQPGGSTLDASGVVAGMHFADLPGQAGVLLTPAVPGMQYDIVNAQKAGPAALTGSDLGTTVIAGGTQIALVRYNGTNWTCSGF